MTNDTAAYLAEHGHALLLVPVEPPVTVPHLYGPLLKCDGALYQAWSSNSQQGEKGRVEERRAPHAPGDVIQVGDQQATVTEVLPPVRVDQLTAEEIEASGIDVARWLPVLMAPGADVDRAADRGARIGLIESRPELTPATWVWREKVNAADAAERE